MAKRNKRRGENPLPTQRRVYEPEIIYAKVPGGIPVAKPASNIQLTPIVQPVAFIPYSTNSQPLLIMDEYDEYE